MIIADNYNGGYSDLHCLPTSNGYNLIAIIGQEQTVYAKSVIVEKIEAGYGSSWDRLFPTILTGGTVIHAQILAVLEPNVPFEGPQEWAQKTELLIQSNLLPNQNLIAFQGAVKAKLALEAAINAYRQTMTELGAIRKSDGTYGDFQSWLEIPQVPGFWVDQ